MSLPNHNSDLSDLWDKLGQPQTLLALGILLLCVLAAFLLTKWIYRTVRRKDPQGGRVMLGEHGTDGLLFPVLAAFFAWLAEMILRPVMPVTVFKFAIPILVSLSLIRLSVRVLRVAFPDSLKARESESYIAWVFWIGSALWVTGIMPLVLKEMEQTYVVLGSTRISVRNLVEGTFSCGIVLMGSLWISSVIESMLMQGVSARDVSVRKIIANSVRAVLVFTGVLVALKSSGIDLTALSVLGGAIGVGVGLGMQKLAANYVSGFMVLAERALRIGDIIKVDGFEGRISDIKMRYTVLRAVNGRESIVPNEMLISQRIESAASNDSHISIQTKVVVGSQTDIPAMQPIIVEALKKLPRVLDKPAPAVFFTGFSADGLELTVVVWIDNLDLGTMAVLSDVNQTLLNILTDYQIEIPYPQRVVRAAENQRISP